MFPENSHQIQQAACLKVLMKKMDLNYDQADINISL